MSRGIVADTEVPVCRTVTFLTIRVPVPRQGKWIRSRLLAGLAIELPSLTRAQSGALSDQTVTISILALIYKPPTFETAKRSTLFVCIEAEPCHSSRADDEPPDPTIGVSRKPQHTGRREKRVEKRRPKRLVGERTLPNYKAAVLDVDPPRGVELVAEIVADVLAEAGRTGSRWRHAPVRVSPTGRRRDIQAERSVDFRRKGEVDRRTAMSEGGL